MNDAKGGAKVEEKKSSEPSIEDKVQDFYLTPQLSF